MNKTLKKIAPALVASVALATSASAATLTGVGTFDGNAGIGTANGDVVAAPTGDGSFVYVSTDGGVDGAAGYGLGGERQGTELTTFNFMADAGDELEYFFNYVTSDGSGFADYAYAELNDIGGGPTINLFNARTVPTGNTVPGNGLPAIDPGVTLDPASTAIVGGGPVWDVLGGSSGSCFAAGCGYTGWVKSTYTIQNAGTYNFTFGVTNWSDNAFDSAFAIAGLKVDGTVIIDPNPSTVPLPAAGWMLLAGLGGMAALGRRRKSS
ncbi:MAG: NF038132 family protein [Pseudomonadota bacterium]